MAASCCSMESEMERAASSRAFCASSAAASAREVCTHSTYNDKDDDIHDEADNDTGHNIDEGESDGECEGDGDDDSHMR